ncbi:hypothetical protein LHK12_10095 [Providencia rettgeri]|nr:hypothetical protein [Providencia rettgeri]
MWVPAKIPAESNPTKIGKDHSAYQKSCLLISVVMIISRSADRGRIQATMVYLG